MREESIVSLMDDLPDSATPAEVTDWVKRTRNTIEDWDSIPGYAPYAVTPEDKRLAHLELDETEHTARREIALAKDE